MPLPRRWFCHPPRLDQPARPLGRSRILPSEKYVATKVMETRRAARIDDRTTLPGPDAEAARKEGFRSVVGAPIMVEGALWGVIVVLAEEILHEDTDTRLTDFTYLVASSISNVHARNNLIASRARIVTASDETRRRIERNLHDGIQQRVVSLTLSLRAVRARSPLPPEVQAGLDEIAHDLEGVLEEIRIFSHGLHPALLARSGLGPSLREAHAREPSRPGHDDLDRAATAPPDRRRATHALTKIIRRRRPAALAACRQYASLNG